MGGLKPCPFCGGEAETRTSTWYDKNYKWTVQCKTNLCMGEFGCAFYPTEAEAIEAWNTREDDYRQAAEYWQRMYENTFTERTCQLIEDSGLLHCSECGGVAEERLWAYWHYCPNCGARVTPKNSETTPKVVSE